MEHVTIRNLRNHGGDVLARVEHGESVTITRDGRPVAELRPLSATPLLAGTLLDRWQHLPPVDPAELRADIDLLTDSSL